jgi:hypothetical protein
MTMSIDAALLVIVVSVVVLALVVDVAALCAWIRRRWR